MLIFPGMLADAAQEAGMKVPEGEEYDEYPHWHIFCHLQLCRPITWGNHWRNAEIIAAVPEEKLKSMTEAYFRELGFDP